MNRLNLKNAVARSQSGVRQNSYQITDSIKLSYNDHWALFEYLRKRLDLGLAMRNIYIDTFRYIDREYYTYLRRDAEDNRRQKDNVRGIGVKPVDEKLSLMFAQIDEAVTFLLTVLAPDEAIYSAIAKKDHQAAAKGFAALMNKHAEKFHHYRQLAIFLVNSLKYNMGAYGVHWRKIMGNLIRRSPANALQIVKGILAEGNELVAYDPYNCLFDPSVSPVEVPELGEFFAVVDLVTEFRLRKMYADGEIFNIERQLDSPMRQVYYASHPSVRNDYAESTNSSDWVSILSRTSVDANDAGKGYEFINMYCWIVPNDFKLGKSKEYEIWRFSIMNGSTVVGAEQLDNAHAMLPVNIAMPYEDHFVWQTKGVAERLIPLQRFASFTMNTHQRATRKRLYGLTIYDQDFIPLMNQDSADLVGGKIPATTNGRDVDLRQKIIQFNDAPDTTNTLQNVKEMNSLMQDVLPTQMAQQVASLDRATQYQAAATVQSANRRNLKLGKIINSQAMDRGREMQMYNILQYQAAMEVLAPDGSTISIDPKEFTDAQLEFTIGDGLKGLDRLSLVMNIKEILNSVLQSQQAASQLDVVGIIDYWTSLIGDNSDFTQFRIASPLDQLPADQRNLAFQLLQQYMQQQKQNRQKSGQQPAAPGSMLPMPGMQ